MVVQRPATVKIDNKICEAFDVIEAIENLEGIASAGIECIQRGIDNAMYVTFSTRATAESLVELDIISVRGVPSVVSFADSKRVYVKVYYLPHEVDNQDVRNALDEFGHVYKIRRDKYLLHKDIFNGVRTVTMTLKNDIPSFISIAGFEAKIYYREQIKTCRICGRPGHFSKNCPEVKCYSCGKYGHVSSECDQQLRCDYCHEAGHSKDRCKERLEDEEEYWEHEKRSRKEDQRKELEAMVQQQRIERERSDEEQTRKQDKSTDEQDNGQTEEEPVELDGKEVVDEILEDAGSPEPFSASGNSDVNNKEQNNIQIFDLGILTAELNRADLTMDWATMAKRPATGDTEDQCKKKQK